jgi:hypothetical protein
MHYSQRLIEARHHAVGCDRLDKLDDLALRPDGAHGLPGCDLDADTASNLNSRTSAARSSGSNNAFSTCCCVVLRAIDVADDQLESRLRQRDLQTDGRHQRRPKSISTIGK